MDEQLFFAMRKYNELIFFFWNQNNFFLSEGWFLDRCFLSARQIWGKKHSLFMDFDLFFFQIISFVLVNEET